MKALVLFLSLSLSLSLFLTAAAYAQEAETVIIVKRATLRGTPSMKGKIITTLVLGTPVELIRVSDKASRDWDLVQTKDYVGWLYTRQIAIVGKRKTLDDLRLETYKAAENMRKSNQASQQPVSPDLLMRLKIEEALRSLRTWQVIVEVKDREVTLTGTVEKDRLAEVIKAVLDADNSIVKVNNKITVK